jgi:hypothetical protein
MKHRAVEILAILDQCADSFTFPMLDNGYVYLAATRLTLFRSRADWAMVTEVFGYSPRASDPDVHVSTFSSNLHNRNPRSHDREDEAYQDYLANNPHNEFGIALQSPPRLHVFELCRYLAGVARSEVLASEEELRVSVAPEMELLLQLDEWHHPNLVAGERPSALRSFQQLAQVLVTGDAAAYRAEDAPNTHWRHWPDGGSL